MESVKDTEEYEEEIQSQISLPDGYIAVKQSDLESMASTEAVEVMDSPETASVHMTYNISVLFVLSMIAGLLVFSCLSRRWSA